MNKKLLAIFFAILAAGLYAINIPLSKLLLNYIEPTMMASYLYLGAGLGIGIVFLLTKKNTHFSVFTLLFFYVFFSQLFLFSSPLFT